MIVLVYQYLYTLFLDPLNHFKFHVKIQILENIKMQVELSHDKLRK